MRRKIPLGRLLAAVALAALAPGIGCAQVSRSVAGPLPTAASADTSLFSTVLRSLGGKVHWPIRVEPRPLSAEGIGVPSPPPFASVEESELRSRAETLSSLAIQEANLQEFLRCAPFIGGMPYKPLPDASPTPPVPVESRRTRQECAPLEKFATVALGVPRVVDDGRYSVRVWIFTAVSEEVLDFVAVRRAPGPGWEVVKTEEVAGIQS